MATNRGALYVRNIIFGVEDSVVSTVGLLSGIAASGQVGHAAILLTGFVYILVEGLSMAIGSYISEESVQEYMRDLQPTERVPVVGAIVMFISFVVAGFVPIIPYLITTGTLALTLSIVLSLVLLGVVAYIHARVVRLPVLGRVLRIVLLGGAAIGLGIVVGRAFGIS